jgi:putative hydroxymethylpyrimidine transport system permease protein
VNRMTVARPLIIAAVILGGWEAFVHLTGQPRFILPAPSVVAGQIAERFDVLAGHFAVTAAEILVGLLCGTLLGAGAALTLAFFRGARQWLLPPLVVSQAVPVFALAPVLTLWVGYGVVSKIAMATLIIFFPVTAAFFDGLRRTEPGWLDRAPPAGGHCATCSFRPRCRPSPAACVSPPPSRRSAPSSASGSAPPPASAT